MFKKIGIVAVCSFCLLLFFPFYAQAINFSCASSFEDIQNDTELCFFVNFLDFSRMVEGYSDQTYRPNNNVTRGEFSKYITNAFDFSSNKEDVKTFSDVDKNNVFYRYVNILKNNEIINGYSDGKFYTDNNITRAEALKIIINSAEKVKTSTFKEEEKWKYSDVDTNHTHKGSIGKAYKASLKLPTENQIINIDEKKFRPDDPITREELAKILVNTLFYLNRKSNTILPPLNESIGGIKANQTEKKEGYEIYDYTSMGVTVIKTNKEINFNYDPEIKSSVREISDFNKYLVAINGSFFGGLVNYNKRTYDYNKQYFRITDSKKIVDLKEEPRDSSKGIGTIKNGEIYEKVLEKSGWYKIKVGEIEGYVNKKQVEKVDLKKITHVMVEGTGSFLRIRESADTNSKVLAGIYDGTIAEKITKQNKWYKIRHGEVTGWVSADFVKEIDYKTFLESQVVGSEYLNVHSGYLNIFGDEKTPIKNNQETNQLSHVVEGTKNLKYFPVSKFKVTDKKTLQFQSGPMLISKNNIERDLIFNSKNGRSKHKRTVIGTTKDGSTIFIVARKEVSLMELSNVILNLEIFKSGEISAINLDGGSSTALYIRDFNEFNFNDEKKIPNIIGIK